jgi:hypothetical protein
MANEIKERIEIEDARDEKRLSTADVADALGRPHTKIQEKEVSEETHLLVPERGKEYRSRWDTIQTSFVDEPRNAVESADSLVAEVMQELAKTFADERQKLEAQWGRGDDVSTEDLRIALQRYRSFFSRLLSI